MARLVSTLAVLAALAAVAGCDQPKAKGKDANVKIQFPTPIAQYSDALARKANALFGDTIEKRASVAGEKAANTTRNALTTESYEQVATSDDCTEDCAGHKDGYAWARSNKVENPNNCPNDKGEAFEEGCRTYGETIQGARYDARTAVLNGKEPPQE